MTIKPATNIIESPVNAEVQQQRIERLAYSKAKKRGFEPGQELKDWLEAESELVTFDAVNRHMVMPRTYHVL
jgi:hypothetical protein